VKGFTQIQGIDYDETFSLVAQFESLRLILALAMLEDWEIHQMDVKSAFLNRLLEEEIYMEQLEGFITLGQESKVCLLKKAIYSLKQASHVWNLQFHGVLVELSFMRMYSNAGIYVYHHQDMGGTLIIILYVNDITIAGDSLKCIQELKAVLSNRYKMMNLGKIDLYLRVNIMCDQLVKLLEINQSCYIQEIVNRFRMLDANPVHTPLPLGAETHLMKYEEQASASEIKAYQQVIGSLLYIQIGTHRDISFAVSHLAQYASNPSPQHM
jgi:hypothetical protein